ncbi:hypothetical protein E4417_20625 [Stenotrophomonas maltophilia]|uniref:hypothetical protein n=1 Tax=Stenotrophomonas maltophilia TaxID=40324 RepID=UPI0010944B7C|nr:hypothetical protein [Stenotrophomonas maltophilia]TGW15930.1 hypothetical protein E4417_20625 [Stenotrophomonas maltophilia]
MSQLRIAAIDDQIASVQVLSGAIQDYLEAEAVPFDRVPATPASVGLWVKDAHIDGVLIDQDLRKGNFSPSSGMEIAAALFKQHCPTVLTTMHQIAELKDGIWYRRYIPAFLSKARLENIEAEMRKATAEVNGKIAEERRAYRTVVRVDDVDQQTALLVVPAFSPSEWISVSTKSLEGRLGKRSEAGMRFMAEVNIGASSRDELFISEVEL